LFPRNLAFSVLSIRRLALLLSISIASLAAGPPAVVAQGFFESLFGGGSSYAPQPNYGYGYAPSHRGRRHGWSARARRATSWREEESRHAYRKRGYSHSGQGADTEAASSEDPGSSRYMCQRSCDGYSFPLPASLNDAGSRRREAVCQDLCPNAETRVQPAKAPDNGPLVHEEVIAASTPLRSGEGSCACQKASNDDERTKALFIDRTLRKGDSVMTSHGLRVFRGASHFPYNIRDFAPLNASRGISGKERNQLAAIERANPRARR
jgi:hypothetical protein